MDERVWKTIRGISTFEDLAQFEDNAKNRNSLTSEIREAVRQQSIVLGRKLIEERTNLSLEALTPAEEKIVEAVSEYVGVMKRQGKDATRTFIQLKNRGLIKAAETAVSKSKPTQGFTTLAEADLADLSYETIIVDHPDEFSGRALWYARRTLGLPNLTSKPPAKSSSAIQSRLDTARAPETESAADEARYWVFVCNSKKWNIDRFLERRIEHDTWGVRDSDALKFASGQLAIIRVGVDQRSNALRNGRTKLNAGIYAICEVETEAFMGEGAGDEDWNPDERPTEPRPTVKIKYLRTFQQNPLTIERLRAEHPQLYHLILDGFQGRSFPIPASDFHTIIKLLDYEIDSLPSPEGSNISAAKLAEMEKKYLRATPEVKERLSQSIERGQIGAFVKKALRFKCQACEALDFPQTTFLKPNGEPYVEAHHVMPVSKLEIGSLAASNIMILCANHHRQMHHGGLNVSITKTTFNFVIDGKALSILRHGIADK